MNTPLIPEGTPTHTAHGVTYVVCEYDPFYYPGGVDKPDRLVQFGRCETCQFETVSNVSYSICPICGNEVYGT